MNRWISISLALLLAFCMAFPVSAKEVAADANPAEVQAEEEFDVDALIAEASKLAYQDLKSASPEMQEKILEARAQIMYNTDWIADGCEGGTFDIKTGEILSTLPHFSEVFPEDWEPPVDKSLEEPAEVQAEEEFDVDALIAEASKLAYQDLKSASPEMQEKILEARAQIMYNTDWIADGCEGGTFDIKTGEILSTLPHFSEVFPEDWEPPVDKSMEQWAENPSSPVLDEPGVQLPKLPGLSSTAETIVEEPIHFPNIPGNVGIAFPS